jgi:hypothetical protein
MLTAGLRHPLAHFTFLLLNPTGKKNPSGISYISGYVSTIPDYMLLRNCRVVQRSLVYWFQVAALVMRYDP